MGPVKVACCATCARVGVEGRVVVVHAGLAHLGWCTAGGTAGRVVQLALQSA